MNVSYISTRNNSSHCIPLSQSLTETKSYTPIPSSLLDYIITTTKLSSIEKLYYILVDNLALINANSGKKRKITLSAEDWAAMINYSPSRIYDLQKSIEEKDFFKVIRKKNEYNQNNRNTIIPTIPSNVFKYLSLSSKKNIKNEYYSFDSSKESKRDFLDRTDYFFKLNYDLLEIITSNDKLTATQKVIWLDLYIRAYGNLKITQNLANKNGSNNNNTIPKDSFYLVASYSELEKKYSCNNSTLWKNLDALKKLGFITKQKVRTLKNSLGGQRKDKLLYEITVTMPNDLAKELSNSKDRSIKKQDNDNEILKKDVRATSKIKNSIFISSILPNFPCSSYSWTLKFNSSYSDDDFAYNLRNINIIPLNIDDSDYIDTNSKNILYSSFLFDSSNLSVFYKNSSFNKNIINSVQTTPVTPKVTSTSFKSTEEKTNKVNDDILLNKSKGNEDNIPQAEQDKAILDTETKNLSPSSCIENSENSKTSSENTEKNKETKEKTFKDFEELSDKLAASLNKKAGRDFSTNFTKKLVQKFAKIYPNKTFPNDYSFYSYMIKALRYEKHQSPLVNHESFNFKENISDEQKEFNKKQKYLIKKETSLDTTPVALLEKKISAGFETNLAYSLLTECQFEIKKEYELEKKHEQFNEMTEISEADVKIAIEARKLIAKHEQENGAENNEIDLDKTHPFKELTERELKELKKKYELKEDGIIVEKNNELEEKEQESVILHNVMVVSISETVTLTDLDKRLLEEEIKFVYGDINIVYKQQKGKVTNYNNDCQKEKMHKKEKDYSPLWQNIREKLKRYFGEEWQSLDKAWFSKLEAEIETDTGKVVIKAPTRFYKDWIKNNFISTLEKVCEILGLELDRHDPIITTHLLN